MPRLAVTLPLMVLLAACSVGSQVQTYEEGEDPLGEREQTYQRSSRLYASPYEKILDESRAAMRDGDYATALPRLRSLAQNPQAEPQWRRQALFLLGQGQGALLNPGKDFQAGIATLERYLELYPEGEDADEARRLIDSYSKLLLQYRAEEQAPG